MLNQDMLENRVKIAYLSIGSNLGNKKKNIDLIKFKLERNHIKIIKSSNKYESLSWPDIRKPKYLNVVLKVKTYLSPKNLMTKCLTIEKELGRTRNKKNEPRICDIDIIDYDNKIILDKTNKFLEIPHPRMHNRNFVLLPLYEISKNWVHPVKKVSITKLIKSLKINDLTSIKIT